VPFRRRALVRPSWRGVEPGKRAPRAVGNIDAVTGRAKPAFTVREGRQILEIDLAIQASARLRREVELATFTDLALNSGSAGGIVPRYWSS
jgi:hypothetical protein